MSFSDLFKPKWKHSDPKVREKAIRKTKDQNLLIYLAKNDENPSVRSAAFAGIDDISALNKIADAEKDPILKSSAASRIKEIVISLIEALNPNNIENITSAKEKLIQCGVFALQPLYIKVKECNSEARKNGFEDDYLKEVWEETKFLIGECDAPQNKCEDITVVEKIDKLVHFIEVQLIRKSIYVNEKIFDNFPVDKTFENFVDTFLIQYKTVYDRLLELIMGPRGDDFHQQILFKLSVLEKEFLQLGPSASWILIDRVRIDYKKDFRLAFYDSSNKMIATIFTRINGTKQTLYSQHDLIGWWVSKYDRNRPNL